MDLQRLLPNNEVCLLEDEPRVKTWRILNASYPELNRIRIQLERELISLAINWIEVFDNQSLMPDEIWAYRLGLVPISADPLQLEDFEIPTGGPTDCSDLTCLVFELDIQNNQTHVIDVLSGDLVWLPIGRQEEFINPPPRPTWPDITLARLQPGSSIHLRAYAIRGTGNEHAKWSTTHAFYRSVPTRLEEGTGGEGCLRCEQLPLQIKMTPGFNCYYFTIRLMGGLTFEQIAEQLGI